MIAKELKKLKLQLLSKIHKKISKINRKIKINLSISIKLKKHGKKSKNLKNNAHKFLESSVLIS